MATGGSQVTRCKKEISAALARSRARRGSSEAGRGRDSAGVPGLVGVWDGVSRCPASVRGPPACFAWGAVPPCITRFRCSRRPLAGLMRPREGVVFTSPVASRPTPRSLLGGKRGEGGRTPSGARKKELEEMRRAPPNFVEGKLQALVSCLFLRTGPPRKVRPERVSARTVSTMYHDPPKIARRAPQSSANHGTAPHRACGTQASALPLLSFAPCPCACVAFGGPAFATEQHLRKNPPARVPCDAKSAWCFLGH